MAMKSSKAVSGKGGKSTMDKTLRTPMSGSMTKGAKPGNPKAMPTKKK